LEILSFFDTNNVSQPQGDEIERIKPLSSKS
jgi:hypothetical protein